MTKEEFAKMLARMMNYQTDFPSGVEEDNFWESLEVVEPAANTIAVKLNDEQFLVTVKKMN